MAGAREVQLEILEKYPTANLRVYTIWLAVLGGDSRSAWRSGAMPDPRVTNLWDEDRIANDWFSEQLDGERGLIWDTYLLYGSDATWESASQAPSQLVSRGSTIASRFSELQASLLPMIEQSRP